MRFLSSRRVNCKSYRERVPFDHCVIDGLFLPEACRAVAEAFPPASDPGWVHYDNPLERKSVLNSRDGEHEAVRGLYETLSDDGFLDLVEQITEHTGLLWDSSLHAAGLCMTGEGGKLDVHKDGIAHPTMPWERVITAILFLNDWPEGCGGELELWSERDGLPFRREDAILPKCGRLLLFDPNGFHGYPDPITCPNVTRKSVQVFYWKQATKHVDRQRAAFSPRPTDTPDPLLDQLRAERLKPRGM